MIKGNNHYYFPSVSKNKRKRKNKGKPGGALQDKGKEDTQPGKKMKTMSSDGKEVEDAVPGVAISTNNKPRLTKAQKRKERKRKIKLAIEAANKTKMPVENQTTATNEAKGKKRKLKECGDSETSIGNGNVNMKDDVSAKKAKLGSAEENYNSLEKTTSPNSEGLRKKRKRRRKKKKQNSISSPDIGSKEVEAKEEKENIETEKLKKETAPDTPDKEAKPMAKSKKKRKRNKKKESTLLNSSQDSITLNTQQQPNTSATSSTQGIGTQTPVLHHSCASTENKERIAKCWKKGPKEGIVVEGM